MIDSLATSTGLSPEIILVLVVILIIAAVIWAVKRLLGIVRILVIAAVVGVPGLGIAGSDVVHTITQFFH